MLKAPQNTSLSRNQDPLLKIIHKSTCFGQSHVGTIITAQRRMNAAFKFLFGCFCFPELGSRSSIFGVFMCIVLN